MPYYLIICIVSFAAVAIAINISPQELQSLEDFFYATNGPHWRWKDVDFGLKWNFSIPNPNPCLERWQGITCSDGCFLTRNPTSAPTTKPTSPTITPTTRPSRHPTIAPSLSPSSVPTSSLNSSIEGVALGEPEMVINFGNDFDAFASASSFTTSDCYIQELYLTNYNLSGTLPDSLGNIPGLKVLVLQDNSLYSTIPHGIMQLRNLTQIYLDVNQLSGSIPDDLHLLKSLAAFSLAANNLNGSIPPNIGLTPKLLYMDISYNALTGSIPASISSLSTLYHFFAPFNSLSGSLPSEFQYMRNLTYLSLSHNSLTGTIPDLSMLANFKTLLLQDNQLQGTIPDFRNWSAALYAITVGSNFITGTISPDVSRLTALVSFDVSNNYMHGTIPSNIGNLTNCIEILLYGNYFSSTLPASMPSLTALNTLLLQGNLFSGQPGNSFNRDEVNNKVYLLQTIDISNNAFTGPIPTQFFSYPRIESIALSENCFHGSLPIEICSVSRTIRVVDLDGLSSGFSCRTRLFGKYSSTFTTPFMSGSITPCLLAVEGLSILHLSGNGFTGRLPETTIAGSLRNLSLSHNRLTGTIPYTVQTHPFKSLDLSFNKLTGTIEDMDQLPLSSGSQLVIETTNGHNKTVTFVNNTSLNLQVNRLSGPMPQNFHDARHINIVTGNLFGCPSQADLPIHDPGSPFTTCGSYVANTAFYITLSIFGCLAVVLFGYLVSGMCRQSRVELDFPRNSQEEFSRNPDSHRKIQIFDADIPSENTIKIDDSCSSHPQQKYSLPIEFAREVFNYIRERPLVQYWTVAKAVVSECPEDLLETRMFLILLHEFRIMFLVIGAYIVFVSLPVYVGVQYSNNEEYSTHTYQYAWAPSIMFTEGTVPTCSLLIVSFVSSLLTLYFINRIDRKEVENSSGKLTSHRIVHQHVARHDRMKSNKTSTETHPISQQNAVRKTWREQIWHFVAYFVLFVGFPLVNIVTILTVNAVYLYITLTQNSKYVFLAQIGLLFWKLVWNIFVIPVGLRVIKTSEIMFVRKLTIQMILYSFNTVVAPLIAGMASSSNCFKNVFISPPEVQINLFYGICYAFSPNGLCLLEVRVPMTTTFTPGFMYSYQCGSAIMQSYVPVFVEMYATLGVAYPTLIFLLTWFLNQARKSNSGAVVENLGLAQLVENFIEYGNKKKFIPGILKLPTLTGTKLGGQVEHTISIGKLDLNEQFSDAQRKQHTSTQSNLEIEAQPVINTKTNTLMNPAVVISHLVCHLVVLLTFGSTYPPLGVVIIIAIAIIIVMWEVLVGRYLFFILQEGIPLDERTNCILSLENSCGGVRRRLFRKARWITIFIKCLFFSVFAVDMTAGHTTVDNWLWAPLSFVVYPILIWLGAFLWRLYNARTIKSVSSESGIDLAPVSRASLKFDLDGATLNDDDLDVAKHTGRLSTLVIRKSQYGRSSTIRNSTFAMSRISELQVDPADSPSSDVELKHEAKNTNEAVTQVKETTDSQYANPMHDRQV